MNKERRTYPVCSPVIIAKHNVNRLTVCIRHKQALDDSANAEDVLQASTLSNQTGSSLAQNILEKAWLTGLLSGQHIPKAPVGHNGTVSI